MAKKFSQPGKKFSVCALSKSVGDIVQVSGFDKIITIYDTQASAVEGLENG